SEIFSDRIERIGRKHVANQMEKQGVEALYRKPATRWRPSKHRIYPYLQGRLEFHHSNQVWAMGITSIEFYS
ncbi:MAG: IS3 family transposase, partial [Pseudomonadota bacterium]|nr:IS3 family transposase [Pseudomonadota bacterium]